MNNKVGKRLIIFVLTVAVCINSMGMGVFAAEQKKTGKIQVYTANGKLIGEYESYEVFLEQHMGVDVKQVEQRSVAGLGVLILKIAAVYGVISMVMDAAYVFTGIDIKTWVRQNLVIPFYNEVKNMQLFSLSGGISNPYPPNSQQYAHFNSTNYYWVVE